MKITAQDLLKFGIIDKIIVEPVGGAHRDYEAVAAAIGEAVEESLKDFEHMSADELRASRTDKFLNFGRKP